MVKESLNRKIERLFCIIRNIILYGSVEVHDFL